jgi:hypothetical protein
MKNVQIFGLVLAIVACCATSTTSTPEPTNPPAAALTTAPDAKGRGTVNITYISNEGFLFETKNKKILIDALYANGGEYYQVPLDKVITQMINGEKPFDNINALDPIRKSVMRAHSPEDQCACEVNESEPVIGFLCPANA